MRLKLTYIATRPNLATPFFPYPADVTDYVNKTYVDTGICEKVSQTVSEDGLTMTTVRIWQSAEDNDEAANDPAIKPTRLAQINYNLENNIITDTRIEPAIS